MRLHYTRQIKISFARLAAIFLGLLILFPAQAELSGSLVPEAIQKRLRPVGLVKISGAKPKADLPKKASGPSQIYKDNCALCHKTGLAGAPKLGSKADWAPRTAQGEEAMLKNAWEGYKAMPPKGNCIDCSKEDIKKTIDYMLKKSK